MNKAFTKEDDGDASPEFRSRFQPLPLDFRNLITARGAATLRNELAELLARLDSPAIQPTLSHLTPDLQRKLLLLRIDDLSKRIETHEVVETLSEAPDLVKFGTTVLVRDDDGNERRYTLVGLDEADPDSGRINWTSPLARALLNQPIGSLVRVHSPKGDVELEIMSVEAA